MVDSPPAKFTFLPVKCKAGANQDGNKGCRVCKLFRLFTLRPLKHLPPPADGPISAYFLCKPCLVTVQSVMQTGTSSVVTVHEVIVILSAAKDLVHCAFHRSVRFPKCLGISKARVRFVWPVISWGGIKVSRAITSGLVGTMYQLWELTNTRSVSTYAIRKRMTGNLTNSACFHTRNNLTI